VVTRYEFEPARGVKPARVIALGEDIARAMSVGNARIATISGRSVIGIELANPNREPVWLRDLFDSRPFRDSDALLPLALGRAIDGEPVIADLAQMPHLLIAGATGTGKSDGIAAMTVSLLYRLAPDQCRFIMIDPQMADLALFNGIPHLLTPVIADPDKASAALDWAVREVEERRKKMAGLGVRTVDAYNARVRRAVQHGRPLARTVQTGFDRDTGEAVFEHADIEISELAYIVIVISELADLMTRAGRRVEVSIRRLAETARAAGIHLVAATERPSADVASAAMKASLPARICFRLASPHDSRAILSCQGAEQLLGHADMLYDGGGGELMRVHGAQVDTGEIERVAGFLSSQAKPRYHAGITDGPDGGRTAAAGRAGDESYEKALALLLRERRISPATLQRHLSLDPMNADRIIARMANEGLVGTPGRGGFRDISIG